MASHKEENPGKNIYTPPPPRPPQHMCCCLRKACLTPGGQGTPKILISISATNPTYILTKNYIYGFQIAFISKT